MPSVGCHRGDGVEVFLLGGLLNGTSMEHEKLEG